MAPFPSFHPGSRQVMTSPLCREERLQIQQQLKKKIFSFWLHRQNFHRHGWSHSLPPFGLSSSPFTSSSVFGSGLFGGFYFLRRMFSLGALNIYSRPQFLKVLGAPSRVPKEERREELALPAPAAPPKRRRLRKPGTRPAAVGRRERTPGRSRRHDNPPHQTPTRQLAGQP